MAQGFVRQLAVPVAVNQGGTGVTTSTGTGAVVLQQSPTINQPDLVGTTTNNNATAGSVGEYTSSVIAFASAVSISTATATNLTSLSLTAGDWDVYGNINFTFSANNGTEIDVWISTTSASVPDQSLRVVLFQPSGIFSTYGADAPFKRISISGTTTVYLTGYVGFASGTATMCGGLYARRIR